MNAKMQISNLLKDLGVPANLLGYKYVRRAIEIVYATPSAIDCVTKVLYPTVAKEFDTTATRVERAIRHAVEMSWDRGDIDKLNEVFRHSYSTQKGKPTNSEFIATIADYLNAVLS